MDKIDYKALVSNSEFSYPVIKKLKRCNPYDRGQSLSCGPNFWDNNQQKLYDQIYSRMDIFQHEFVEWADISNPEKYPFDVSIKYDKLGIKDLVSCKLASEWYEGTVKQFSGTLFVKPDRSEIEFMIDSRRFCATKEDIEKALNIKPIADSIVLHKLPELSDIHISSLMAVSNRTRLVRDLKAEVQLIQKINRRTILPKSSNRGNCSSMLLKLAHTIYHGKHFDVAHFLLSEMSEAIETPDHPLPYAPHIFCLLDHLKLFPTNHIGNKCSFKKYSPKVPMVQRPNNLDSVVASFEGIKKCQEEVFKILHEEVFKRLEKLEKRLENMEENLNEVVKIVERRFSGLTYKRRKTLTDGDGPRAAADP